MTDPLDEVEDDLLGSLLTFDALGAAEDITGDSYKTDVRTMGLGMALHLNHSKVKREALQAAGDTHRSIDFWDAIEIVEALGFDLISQYTFERKTYRPDDDHRTDVRALYWRDGLLLEIESYEAYDDRLSTNSISVQGNLFNGLVGQEEKRYPRDLDASRMMHGPSWDDDGIRIIIFRRDGLVDGLAYFLRYLPECGEILPVWKGSCYGLSHIVPSHYDEAPYDWQATREQREANDAEGLDILLDTIEPGFRTRFGVAQ